MISKGVTSEYFHTHTDFIIYFIFFKIAVTALKYETPMFQEFRTQNWTHAYLITVLFLIWVYVYALFFKINSFFSKALLDAVFHSNAKIWFQKQ